MKPDRLLGILTILRQNDESSRGGFVTAPYLAKRFEVNRRTIGRDIPDERRNFVDKPADGIRLVALFDPSQRYKLIEYYGINCYTETSDGLRFETVFTNRDYITQWLLEFGGNVKVLEPDYIADGMVVSAKKFRTIITA